MQMPTAANICSHVIRIVDVQAAEIIAGGCRNNTNSVEKQ
jgi:hypothetical protein